MKGFLLSILISSICIIKAPAQTCCCDSAFIILQQQVKEVYPGYELIQEQRPASYQAMVKKIAARVNGLPSFSYKCLQALSTYLLFFNDAHISLSAQIPENISADSLRLYYGGVENIRLSKKVLPHISRKKQNDPIVGFWTFTVSGNSRFHVAIVPRTGKPGKFLGIVTDSATPFIRSGFLLLELMKQKSGYAGKYYFSRANPIQAEVKLNNAGNAFMLNQRVWTKQDETGGLPDSTAFGHLIIPPGNFYASLSPQTSYLRMGSFQRSSDSLTRLIQNNLNEIIQKPYLIIDIRNNRGGAASGFQELFGYINDTMPRFARLDYLTKSSLAAVKGYRKLWTDMNNMTDRSLRRIKMLEDSLGKTFKWQLPEEIEEERYADTARRPQLPNKISRIVVLQNRMVGSAAEMFVNIFSASPKVHFMGTHTGGIIDKVSVQTWHAPIHDLYTLYLPCAIRIGAKESPLDPIGFPPDIEYDSVDEDWIKIAQKMLENNEIPELPKRFRSK